MENISQVKMDYRNCKAFLKEKKGFIIGHPACCLFIKNECWKEDCPFISGIEKKDE